MYNISVHCVYVLLLLLFCCTVKRNSTEFVEENTEQTHEHGGKKLIKILWIYDKTVLSGTSSVEILTTMLQERKTKAASS